MSTLRKWFGPSREEVWRQLATDLGARYVEGTFLKGDKVQATHGEWTITLDTFYNPATKTVFTRLTAPYVNADGFRFTVYRRGLFSDLGKALGMQDVEVGHPEFDQDFIIKGTDPAKLRALFDAPRIRELLTALPHVHFTVRDDDGTCGSDYPEDADQLCFTLGAGARDVDRLKQLFDLFAETLDQLCRIGSAYEDAPAVEA
jgi:hypothetical protein